MSSSSQLFAKSMIAVGGRRFFAAGFVKDIIPDFSQLIKVYSQPQGGGGERCYSPAQVIKAIPTPVWGTPDPERISTSHVERQNLTMRMMMRRLNRLPNAFSKKWDNLKAALALHFAYYNFCRIHKSLRCTPAMAAGVTTIWELKELLSV